MRTYWIILAMNLLLYACNSFEKEQMIIKEGMKIVGSIDKDSSYNGLMRFYNIKSGKLLYEANYLKGKLNGESRYYYQNGNLSAKQYFSDDKINGFIYAYDSSGSVYYQTYYYYGIHTGPNIYYKEKKPFRYSFYSLDNNILFNIDYDSIPGKKISDLQKSFFFFHVNYFDDLEDGILRTELCECFIYLPNPPGYKFEYSLVNIDSSFKVLSTIKKIENNEPFTTFSLTPFLNKYQKPDLALKLDVYDSTNNVMGHFFKRIFPPLSSDSAGM